MSQPRFSMAKYSDEFKLKIVMEYLSGGLSYNRLAQKYGLLNQAALAFELKEKGF